MRDYAKINILCTIACITVVYVKYGKILLRTPVVTYIYQKAPLHVHDLLICFRQLQLD